MSLSARVTSFMDTVRQRLSNAEKRIDRVEKFTLPSYRILTFTHLQDVCCSVLIPGARVHECQPSKRC